MLLSKVLHTVSSMSACVFSGAGGWNPRCTCHELHLNPCVIYFYSPLFSFLAVYFIVLYRIKGTEGGVKAGMGEKLSVSFGNRALGDLRAWLTSMCGACAETKRKENVKGLTLRKSVRFKTNPCLIHALFAWSFTRVKVCREDDLLNKS